MKAEGNVTERAVDRRGLMGFSVAAAAAALASARSAQAEDSKPMLMFVQLAESVKIDEAAKTIRLVNVSPHTSGSLRRRTPAARSRSIPRSAAASSRFSG